MKTILLLITLAICASAQTITATTADGRKVILLSDGTWKFAESSDVANTALSIDSFSEKQVTAFKDAVMALRKLGDGISFGITYSQYQTKMGEVKTLIDNAELLLPEGKPKQSIKDAWALYLEASLTWQTMRELSSVRLNPEAMEKTRKLHPNLKTANPNFVTREEILSACWSEAEDKIKPLVSLAAK